MSESSAAASVDRIDTRDAAGTPMDQLIATVARLRGPGGCPWDAEQTHASLVQYLVEETHELVDAIEAGTRAEMIEELGDVLYQVILHSDIAAHTADEDFTVQDVAEALNAKLIARHPHVFGDRVAETSEDVVAFWDELKAAEKPERSSVLDGVPQGMPALALADKLLGKAQKLELVESNPDAGIPCADEGELGSMLLAIVASAKARGLDAERALRNTLREFQNEIREAEAILAEDEPRPAAE